MPPSSIMSILHRFAFPFRNFLETVIATIDATGKPGTSVLIDLSIVIVLAGVVFGRTDKLPLTLRPSGKPRS